MSAHYNQLSPAEAERLAILAEECAEVIQAVCKILRHGYDSTHPDDLNGPNNRAMLMTELGHIEAVKELMFRGNDIKPLLIRDSKDRKLARIHRYLHHQS